MGTFDDIFGNASLFGRLGSLGCQYAPASKDTEKASDNFKGNTYDAEFEEVKKKGKWWFQDQPKALLK